MFFHRQRIWNPETHLLKPSGCGRDGARNGQLCRSTINRFSVPATTGNCQQCHSTASASHLVSSPSHCRPPNLQDKTADTPVGVMTSRPTLKLPCSAAFSRLARHILVGEMVFLPRTTTTAVLEWRPATTGAAGCSATLAPNSMQPASKAGWSGLGRPLPLAALALGLVNGQSCLLGRTTVYTHDPPASGLAVLLLQEKKLVAVGRRGPLDCPQMPISAGGCTGSPAGGLVMASPRCHCPMPRHPRNPGMPFWSVGEDLCAQSCRCS